MTSSIRTLLCLMLSLCSFLTMVAKETVFYKLVPKKSSVKATGGQFITFIGDQCFDSNNVGVSVYNGKLKKNLYQSTAEKIIYTGTSFYGTNSKYIFTNNKKNLCIVAPNGETYQYIESVAPKGQRTCTLIKGNSTSNDDYSETYYPQNHSNQHSNSFPSLTTHQGTSPIQKSTTDQNRNQRKKCLYTGAGDKLHCGGDGKCSRCGGDGLMNGFGINNVKCSQCNGSGKCISCHGTGFIDK